MSEIIEKLKDWGCDVEGAMERMIGDEDFYRECLEMFVEDENYQKLGEALTQGKYQDAFDYAHTMKGVAANLGLTPMFEKTSEIVEPLRSGDYSNLDEQYKQVGIVRDQFFAIMNR